MVNSKEASVFRMLEVGFGFCQTLSGVLCIHGQAIWFPPPPIEQRAVPSEKYSLQSLGNIQDFFPEFLFSATVHLFLICARIQTIRKFGFCAVAISAPPVVWPVLAINVLQRHISCCTHVLQQHKDCKQRRIARHTSWDILIAAQTSITCIYCKTYILNCKTYILSTLALATRAHPLLQLSTTTATRVQELTHSCIYLLLLLLSTTQRRIFNHEAADYRTLRQG